MWISVFWSKENPINGYFFNCCSFRKLQYYSQSKPVSLAGKTQVLKKNEFILIAEAWSTLPKLSSFFFSLHFGKWVEGWRDQMAIFRNWFPPFTMWVSGIKLRVPGLTAGAFPHWVSSLTLKTIASLSWLLFCFCFLFLFHFIIRK